MRHYFGDRVESGPSTAALDVSVVSSTWFGLGVWRLVPRSAAAERRVVSSRRSRYPARVPRVPEARCEASADPPLYALTTAGETTGPQGPGRAGQ